MYVEQRGLLRIVEQRDIRLESLLEEIIGGVIGGVIAKDEALLRRKRPRGRLKNVVGVLKVRDS
jgi:hypothetical protein